MSRRLIAREASPFVQGKVGDLDLAFDATGGLDAKLFSGIGGFEVAAGGFGLGLVSAAGAGLLILLNCFITLVEEVEHLACVELGTATEPFAAFGLGGGVEIIFGGFGDEVLTALGVGEAEVGHLEARVDEVIGLAGVFKNFFVDADCSRAVALVLGKIGLF